MVFSILALLFSVGAIVLFTQPMFGIYNIGNEKINAEFSTKTLFDMIKFEKGQNIYLTVGSILLILTLVFAGLTILLTLLNMIARATTNKSYVGTKFVSFFFFIFAIAAGITYALYMAKVEMSLEVWQAYVDKGIVFSIGWGMICVMVCSLLSFVFSPRKKKE